MFHFRIQSFTSCTFFTLYSVFGPSFNVLNRNPELGTQFTDGDLIGLVELNHLSFHLLGVILVGSSHVSLGLFLRVLHLDFNFVFPKNETLVTFLFLLVIRVCLMKRESFHFHNFIKTVELISSIVVWFIWTLLKNGIFGIVFPLQKLWNIPWRFGRFRGLRFYFDQFFYGFLFFHFDSVFMIFDCVPRSPIIKEVPLDISGLLAEQSITVNGQLE